MRILLLILLLVPMRIFAQSATEPIQVIAKLISPGEGSKIQIATYEVLKVLSGKVHQDTILVGYYFYLESPNLPDTALLHLVNYTDGPRGYYTFPRYDPAQGIEPVQVSHISFDYWEGLETGKGEGKPLTFTRKNADAKWFLFMPCGGTHTAVYLTPEGEKDHVRATQNQHEECPPVFDLTDLPDGKYTALMIACGLGGPVKINLQTLR
ncbi:MAG: hypothetical protein H6581_18235 [Bacteroidia bacterium]|nr:hypothetical protein [Bacteroidia bacterium]